MISDNIKRFVVMDDADRLIAAYYVLLTFVYDRLDICPKLLITAPVMQAGKSRLASTLGHMSCRPLFFANMSPAVMYRVVEEVQPTMIIAEADAWLKDNEELRGLINAGHERDEAFAWRMVKDADGNMTATKFSVFGPQIISGIGTLHGTMMSRAFVIRMQPKRADQQIDRLRSRNKGTLVAAQRCAARWAVDFGDKLQSIETPVMPEHWRDRQQDNAEVLLTLATIGGVEMVNNLRTALNLSYARENKKQLPTLATQLLTDIYDCYVARGQAHNNGKLHNEEIIEQLLKMEEAPWATFERGQPLGRPKMGRMLKDFNVRSIQIKRSGKNKRGMTFDEINRAVETFAPAHLAPDTAVLGATPLPSAETLGKTGSTTALEKLPGTAGCYPENLQNSAEGSRVAPFEPETGCAPGGGGLSVVGNNPANESCLVEGDPLALPDFRRSRGSGDARNGDESDLDEVM